MNKPVIAVSSMETREFRPYIHCYSTYEELEALSQEHLEVPFLSSKEMEDFIINNSWEKRSENIEKILKGEFV